MVHEFPVDTVQYRLQIVAFPWVLAFHMGTTKNVEKGGRGGEGAKKRNKIRDFKYNVAYISFCRINPAFPSCDTHDV